MGEWLHWGQVGQLSPSLWGGGGEWWGPLPPTSPPDPISMLSCSCSQQGPQTAVLRSLGRYQQLLITARAVPVQGQHVPQSCPWSASGHRAWPLRPPAKTSCFATFSNISKPPEVLLRPEVQKCAWPPSKARKTKGSHSFVTVMEPWEGWEQGAAWVRHPAVIPTYSVTVGRWVVLPGCLSPSLPKATGLGGERLSPE